MRTVVFEGNSLETLRQFPDETRLRAGYEIDRVQRDKKPENWKPFPSVDKVFVRFEFRWAGSSG